MKLWLPGIFLSLLWIVTLVAFAIPEPPNSHGKPHSQFAGMDQGGPAARHTPLLLSGWLMGSLLIGGGIGLLAWATVKLPANASGGRLLKWGVFGGFGLIYEALFAVMVWTYGQSIADPLATPFWGPFPNSTACLVFGIWLLPAILIAFYVILYDSWIAPPAHVARFEQLVKETRSKP